jgi:glycosyltransferase involved in cell wall biosynthesis
LAPYVYYIFLLSLLVQLFFFLFIFSRLLFFKEIPEEKETRGISVIIAAHDEKPNLLVLIPELLGQNYTDFEVIVADDRSADGTFELLQSFNDVRLKIIRIDEVPGNINPKKNALTRAIAMSSKEHLLFTDADCRPLSKDWIKEMQQGFSERKDIVLGYSPYFKAPGFLNLFIRYETFYTAVQYLSFALSGRPYMGVGRNLAYKKKLFINNQGFNSYQHVTGGDDDLFIKDVSNNNNTSIRINHKSQIHSIPKSTFPSWINQKKRHLSVGTYYRLKDQIALGMLNISHICFYLSFIYLCLIQFELSFIILGFMLRTSVFIASFVLILKKSGDSIKWYVLPVLDLIYILYYTGVGTIAIFSKNIRWM